MSHTIGTIIACTLVAFALWAGFKFVSHGDDDDNDEWRNHHHHME